MFDTSFVYGLLDAVTRIQQVGVGLFALVIMAALARVILWAILAPVLGRTAGPAADLIVGTLAFILMAGSHGPDILDWAYGLACRAGLAPPELSGFISGVL